MQRFARWHIWLGWMVVLPLLMWTITGLIMVARPIETVRGEGLTARPTAVDPDKLVFPKIGEPVNRVALANQALGPVWIVTTASGQRMRYSATQGFALSPVVRDEARQIAAATYTGSGKLENLAYIPSDAAPMDLRPSADSWQARYSDDTHLYIDAGTGEILAVRTGWWRIYDFMWGLHIMDPATREKTHNPLVIASAVLSFAGVFLGALLLFRRRKTARR
jgi:uncharacterized iron-regulated membrane protein